MIDKHLTSFLDAHFKNENKVRCLITYINGVIHVVFWDEIGTHVKGPKEFIDDIYELVSNYNVDEECVIFTDNNKQQYLMRIKKC